MRCGLLRRDKLHFDLWRHAFPSSDLDHNLAETIHLLKYRSVLATQPTGRSSDLWLQSPDARVLFLTLGCGGRYSLTPYGVSP